MIVFKHPDEEAETPRSHPWTEATTDSTHKYYDFKSQPALIRSTLEDFVPLNHWPAVATFYEFLEWLNGPGSELESNDCGTRGPRPNQSPNFGKPLECTARLMILYRHLAHNVSEKHIEWLEGAIHHYVEGIDTAFEWGVLGTTKMRANYITLPIPKANQARHQLMLTFWAWGESESEVMGHLGRSFVNVYGALVKVSQEIAAHSETDKLDEVQR